MLMRAWEPREYQIDAVRWLVSHPEAALFSDPGLGKTACTLAAAQILLERGAVRRVLVVAPLRVATMTWPEEMHREWSNFRGVFKSEILHGPRKMQALERAADPTVNVLVLNPDGLAWFVKEAPRKLPGKLYPDMLVVDESTMFKHGRSQRSRLLRTIMHNFRRRVILTGTPTPNGYEDLWGQLFVCDAGKALGRYFSHYLSSYFDRSGYGGYTYTLRRGAESAIRGRIQHLVLRQSVAENLPGLPQRVNVRVDVDLPPAARTAYKQVEKLLFSRLAGGDVVARNVGAAMNKCRQIACGAVYVEDETRRWEALHDAKIQAARELVDSLQGTPLLLAYEYGHDLSRLQAEFPHAEALVGPTKADADRIRRWNAGEIPVLLVHPKSAGHGLNLQHGGNHLAWFSAPWDLELYEQTCCRLDRSGQRKSVVVHHFVARETVDENIVRALNRKALDQNELLRALEKRAGGSQR